MLYSITIDYTYYVNDFKIQRSFIADTSKYTLKNRILGDHWKFEKYIDETDELPITTDFGFYPCRPVSSLGEELLTDSEANKEALRICPLVKRYNYDYTSDLSLRFTFKLRELAANCDFSLESEGVKRISNDPYCIETQDVFEAKFLKYPIKFYFKTQFPREIKGHIENIKITPTFYTVEA